MFKQKTNRKLSSKLTLIALVFVLATAVALIPLFTKSVAYASGTPATFLRTRSGTISDPGSDRAFAEYNFQRNENNFYHIEAAAIADLVDNKYDGVDLRTQSNAIKQTAI